MTASALYAGSVFHRRVKPRAHLLRHSLFQMLFDIDELDTLDARLKLFSRGGFNLFAFHDRDHGDGSGDLRAWAERLCVEAGVDGSGPVRLLCMPRILGHVFNPITVWFCHDREGRPSCLIHQVNNTFGERHSYVVPVTDPDAAVIVQQADKHFYVSPFMAMDMRYDFAVQPPGRAVTVRIDGSDDEGLVIATAFTGARRELNDGTLLAALFGYPLMTLKVLWGIHWGALRLLLKGVRYRSRPPAPDRPATVSRAATLRRAA